jgi:hypothetical protein
VDAVLLVRLQFGFTAGFHFLFPPTTLGPTLIILILETLYLKSKLEPYKTLSSFLVKILGLVFVMGAATGITLEFAFGNNWSNYARVVGDLFGAPWPPRGSWPSSWSRSSWESWFSAAQRSPPASTGCPPSWFFSAAISPGCGSSWPTPGCRRPTGSKWKADAPS